MSSTPDKRRGRPKSADSLGVDVRVRIHADTNRKLLAYCDRHDIQRAPAIRRAIEEMLEREDNPSAEQKQDGLASLLDF